MDKLYEDMTNIEFAVKLNGSQTKIFGDDKREV
jgi:hypothetical protein